MFLAEAFTRPPMMHALAKVGFQQSYTYFTWRNTKLELRSTSPRSPAGGRLHAAELFPTTPDILTEFLQYGGPAAYKIRAASRRRLAQLRHLRRATSCSRTARGRAAEENIDNEKYEYKPRDWAAAEKARDVARAVPDAAQRDPAAHPALASCATLRPLEPRMARSWSTPSTSTAEFTESGVSDTIIVVVNVDPHSVREATVHLDPTQFGFVPGDTFPVTDLLTGAEWTWGDPNYVRLDAFVEPVHILSIQHAGPAASSPAAQGGAR